jgi:hypothetical protein
MDESQADVRRIVAETVQDVLTREGPDGKIKRAQVQRSGGSATRTRAGNRGSSSSQRGGMGGRWRDGGTSRTGEGRGRSGETASGAGSGGRQGGQTGLTAQQTQQIVQALQNQAAASPRDNGGTSKGSSPSAAVSKADIHRMVKEELNRVQQGQSQGRDGSGRQRRGSRERPRIGGAGQQASGQEGQEGGGGQGGNTGGLLQMIRSALGQEGQQQGRGASSQQQDSGGGSDGERSGGLSQRQVQDIARRLQTTSGLPHDNAKATSAVAVAQVLTQAQWELSQELENNLKQLRQVIRESQAIAQKIEQVLGQGSQSQGGSGS